METNKGTVRKPKTGRKLCLWHRPKVTVKETGRAACRSTRRWFRRADPHLGIGLQDRWGVALKPLGWLILP